MLFAIVCRPKVGKSPCVKEVSIRGDGNHGCGGSCRRPCLLCLQTILNHKTGDDSKAFIKMARAGNAFKSAFILFDIINYRFLTTETNLKALCIFRCLFTTSSVKLFVVNVQIFVYNCVFPKKDKQHSQNLSHFENESTF